jgi:hypothetical protein
VRQAYSKGKETSIQTTDTVTLTAGIWEKELAEIETMDEEEALLLAQVTASNLGKQSFSIYRLEQIYRVDTQMTLLFPPLCPAVFG